VIEAARLPFTFACGLTDRMVPLYSREVQPDGLDFRFMPVESPAALLERLVAGELDAAEWSSSNALARSALSDQPFVAIPAFPARAFRHATIFVSRDSRVVSPRQLEGRRVGVPSFTMTAAIWIRGLLQHEYCVDLSRIEWIEDAPPRPASAILPQTALETKFRLTRNTTGKPLEVLLDEGAIDAFIGADVPEPMRRSAKARRLFPNFHQLDRDYYRRTKVFPIHRTVVIRRDVYERHPFVAKSLFDALERSKDLARRRMRDMGTLRYMLPWMIAEIEELDELFGGDPFVYGLEPNRRTLETELQYLADQAMLPAPVDLNTAFVDVGA
jgi:4,5-dihydroxyphthalate decarboxylase